MTNIQYRCQLSLVEIQHSPHQLHDVEVHQVVGPIQVGCGLDGLWRGEEEEKDSDSWGAKCISLFFVFSMHCTSQLEKQISWLSKEIKVAIKY